MDNTTTPNAPAVQAGMSYEMDITGLADGGRGLSREPQGRVVLVDGALPGERVLASVRRVHKDYVEAAAIDIIQKSPQRVEPACPMYGRCGGCDLMHLEYSSQLKAKVGWVERSLSRLDGMPPVESFTSPAELGYRNRIRLHHRQKRLGFFAAGTRELVEVDSCPVAAEPASALMAALDGKLDGAVRWLELLLGAPDKSFITLGFGQETRLSKSQRRRYISLGRQAGAAGVRLCFGKRLTSWPCSLQTGTGFYSDEEGTEIFAFPGLFSQVNFAANRELVQRVCELAGAGDGGTALDLYAGSGNFSLPLAARNWQVTAVENAYGAGDALDFSAQRSGVSGSVEFMPSRVEPALAQLTEAGKHYDLVVLDPPRAGAKGLMGQVAALGPEKIIYVSCHAATLARDTAALLAAGYEPKHLQVADLFPQTSQVEAVLVLDKS